MGKPYAKYLKTEHWKEFKQKVLDHYGHKCQKCGSVKNLNVHHLTYNHLQNETFDDVIILCRYCHNKEHHSDCPHINKKPCSVTGAPKEQQNYYCYDCRCII